MVIQNLKSTVVKKQGLKNKDFLRNLLKEELQVFVLNFVYTSSMYRNLIFTGGTCLRKFYNLPRISEDLDLDIDTKAFDFSLFQKNIKNYFYKDLQYKDLDLKFKNQTLFLRFPVLWEIGFSKRSDTNILFLRLDFAFNKSKNFKTEKLLFSSYDFSFLVRAYDFSTLMANKAAAFLTREYKKGREQAEPFKGRDVFDLVWMLGKSKEFGQKMNLKRVYDLTGITTKAELSQKILEKAGKIRTEDLFNDLKGFFESLDFVSGFCQNFRDLFEANIKYL